MDRSLIGLIGVGVALHALRCGGHGFGGDVVKMKIEMRQTINNFRLMTMWIPAKVNVIKCSSACLGVKFQHHRIVVVMTTVAFAAPGKTTHSCGINGYR
mgnify:CR=1 FL=1